MDQKQTHLKGTRTKAGRHILQEAKALPPEQGQQNFTISWEKVKQKRVRLVIQWHRFVAKMSTRGRQGDSPSPSWEDKGLEKGRIGRAKMDKVLYPQSCVWTSA
jgi:hypothetical protein